MNGKDEFINGLKIFMESPDKGVLITGTNRWSKHKIVLAYLNKFHSGSTILFRTNALKNVTNEEFLGFAGVKKTPKSNVPINIDNLTVVVDSLFNKSTKAIPSFNFDYAIVYPIDALMRKEEYGRFYELLDTYSFKKIFFISWTDHNRSKYKNINNLFQIELKYDIKEVNEKLHNEFLRKEND